ncbi:putative deoxyuridine 5-triphosphate nucleotidohydrolase [Rhypophila decipiens]|uniref:Deoxyuridine 5'-triphosphate nucleotidohydrolase n=1 Tax=Rhypophila decipiens TaxID=261697 RepID=A0AAN7BE45_9PEZI|nr:putative deoxyuridine 5-triphosphate nucleotidohydrolase [Rhypophila decipiens]
MTSINNNEPVVSPPNSPPAKRIKTNTTTTTTTTTTQEEQKPTVTMATAEQVPALQVEKITDKARIPTRGSADAAGYDLSAAHKTTIPARGRGLVDTDLKISVPAGAYGRIAPRSGLAVKNGIQTGAGVIDADYRGPVKVLLFNHSDEDFQVTEGQRIAQLILERIYTPEVVVVEKLEESVRGAGGFGSTGTH